MAVMVTDPIIEKQLRDAWTEEDTRREEVWEGVLVMPPMADTEHQIFVMKVAAAFSSLVDWDAGDFVLPGGNVSDRDKGWLYNYRIPDVIVCLAGGVARNCDTHLVGGPDLLVEIASPGEDPHAKLVFYSQIGTRELLVLDRDPWALELFELRGGKLVSAGRSDLATPAILASGVLPVTFQLQPGKTRPVIDVVQSQTGQRWTA